MSSEISEETSPYISHEDKGQKTEKLHFLWLSEGKCKESKDGEVNNNLSKDYRCLSI